MLVIEKLFIAIKKIHEVGNLKILILARIIAFVRF